MGSITKFQFEQMQRRRPGSAGVSPAPSAPLEKQLHQDIIAHCHAQWPRWKFVHSRMDRATNGDQRGVPDFVIALPGARTLYIEAKRPGEKISPAQRDWHAEMTALGHTVHVVHTIQEFVSIIGTPASGTARSPQSAIPNPQPAIPKIP